MLTAGATSIPSGGQTYVELDLNRGNYAALSSNTDQQNQTPEHVEFTVN